jgi:hypothetical protein
MADKKKKDLADELLDNYTKNWDDPDKFDDMKRKQMEKAKPSGKVPKGKKKPPALKDDGSQKK